MQEEEEIEDQTSDGETLVLQVEEKKQHEGTTDQIMHTIQALGFFVASIVTNYAP